MPLISAILLAAGRSQRMGQPKMLLPWGETSVLGRVVATFAAGLSMDSETGDEILIVTGGARELVEAEVGRLAKQYPLRSVYNPDYAQGEMISSIKAGLAALGPGARAALIGLGDQPQVRQETIRHIYETFVEKGSSIIIPSYQNRRGHPWLVTLPLWPEILALSASATPRQFLNAHAGQIEYVAADNSILQDLDTPEEYQRQRPR